MEEFDSSESALRAAAKSSRVKTISALMTPVLHLNSYQSSSEPSCNYLIEKKTINTNEILIKITSVTLEDGENTPVDGKENARGSMKFCNLYFKYYLTREKSI